MHGIRFENRAPRRARVTVPDHSADRFNYCLEFWDEVPEEVLDLVELLKLVVTLPHLDGIDLAIALDFYKDPSSHEDSMHWSNTEVGELIYRGKYYKTPSADRQTARMALVNRMVSFVQSHPDYAAADVIVAAPGHAGDGQSFGEQLAYTVSKHLDLPFVRAVNRNGPREPQKEGVHLDEGTFTMQNAVSGRVLLIDDVFRSGATMVEVGRAARAVGAVEVLGLTAVRTMRR